MIRRDSLIFIVIINMMFIVLFSYFSVQICYPYECVSARYLCPHCDDVHCSTSVGVLSPQTLSKEQVEVRE